MITAVLCWDNFADYHVDRVRALMPLAEISDIQVICVELVGRTSSHRWANKSVQLPRLIRIFDSEPQSFYEWVQFTWRLGTCLARLPGAVIFVPSYSPLRPALTLMVSKILGRRVVMMNDSHAKSSQSGPISALIKRLILKLFDAGFVAGQLHVRHFASLGMSANTLFAGYDAVDGEALRSRAADKIEMHRLERHFRAPENAFLFIGRLIWQKNLEILIKAYAQTSSELGSAVPALIIVGEGEQKEQLKALVVALGLQHIEFAEGMDLSRTINCVCFYPFCKNSETAYFYKISRALVLPSRSETWGLVVAEALAIGTPVFVSSHVGCVEDLVISDVNGASFDPYRADELAVLLRRAVSDPPWLTQLRSGATMLGKKIDINDFSAGFISAVKAVTLRSFEQKN